MATFTISDTHRAYFPEHVDFTKQSVVVPGTKKAGQTGHYRSGVFGLLDLDTPGTFRTLPEVFALGLKLAPQGACLGSRKVVSTTPLKFGEYEWQTYEQVDVRRRNLGSALHTMFNDGTLGGGELNTVGIWSQNRPEWQIIDFAIQAYGPMASVALYDTLGAEAVEYIIEHAHLTVVFATADHIPALLKVAAKLPMLKMVVSMNGLSADSTKILSAWGASLGIQVKTMAELEAFGATKLMPVKQVFTDTVATLCYTSGTTSMPKGVVLTHGHLAISTQSNLIGNEVPVGKAVIFSYLPLAHIYSRFTELTTIAMGGSIGFFSGDPLRLLEDAQLLRPTVFPSVPRVLNRVYQAAMVAANAGGIKGALFKKGMQVKLDQLHATGNNKHAFWDRLIFNKIHAVLGGNLILVGSGSAPISADVMDFLKIALACEVCEGYGMTENCGTIARCLPRDPSSTGSVGPPQPVNEMKLLDVPAMNYTSEDKPNPRGEICVRGANCFSVYYKDEKNTKESITEDGWFRTGDVGEIDAYGRLKIIDRVKNIMKLAQGEYVALEKIENMYTACPIVGQLYVHGDSLQSHLIAVVIPDPIQLAALASKVLKEVHRAEDAVALRVACEEPKVVQAVLEQLTKEGKKNGMKGFEMVKALHLSLDMFSVEDGTLTPTFKVKRRDAYNKFKKELDGLYATSGDARL